MPFITLPHGGPGAGFESDDLIKHIEKSRRDYIIQGQKNCVFAKHPKPQSLDFWLRKNFSKQKDTKQAVNEVIDKLVSTGLFLAEKNLICPDSRRRCKGIKIKKS